MIGDKGSVLEVGAIRQGGLVLRDENGNERLVRWETLTDRRTEPVRLAYGYAMMTNAAQGVTSSEHILVTQGGSQATEGHHVYISGSQHRERATG